jgi:condensin complex subunit 1
MLHLIWSKNDSSVSEDGKELKGVKSKLLECYNDLYFAPIEGLEDKAQTKRTAKNMIE